LYVENAVKLHQERHIPRVRFQNMPPLRGLRFFFDFYKDVAPTALEAQLN
jgi:hypothetical protein